ncbi:hypothetical protein ES703_19532 [subsurface metagenome]
MHLIAPDSFEGVRVATNLCRHTCELIAMELQNDKG